MKFGLLGAKLSHSYSPFIHKKIFEYININATYELIELSCDKLEEQISKLRAGEYQGYNVTIPYKKEVMKYLDEISEEAKAIGSVNTIAYINGKVVGYNTDYYGFYETMIYNHIDVLNKDCYILGTGGASLAIYKVLNDLGGNVTYVSRSPNENSISYDVLATKNIDIIVNTTPVGMYPNVGISPVSKEIAQKAKVVIDIVFNPLKTQLLLDSNSHFHGLYMLVGQAIKAEEIWHNKKIDLVIEDIVDCIVKEYEL
jgi:shikimate dehydrogenase